MKTVLVRNACWTGQPKNPDSFLGNLLILRSQSFPPPYRLEVLTRSTAMTVSIAKPALMRFESSHWHPFETGPRQSW